jgi:CheY-like chemotaxis protein
MTNLLVLVVDDNLVSRLLPSFILRPFSGQVQVVECETGIDALRLLETHHVTHVLLDISMPGLDGIQVAKEIKSKARSPHFRLIAYTADALVTNEARLKSVGFDDVLLKPLKSEALLKSLGLTPTTPLGA